MGLSKKLRDLGLYLLLRNLCIKTLSDLHASDKRLAANSLYELGAIGRLQGKYEEARSFYQQSLAIFERLENQGGRASCLFELGNLAWYQGEYKKARDFYQQSLEIAEQLGDQSIQASSLGQLGAIASAQGEYEEARGLYQQSLDIHERLGNRSGRATSLGEFGLLAYERGNLKESLIYMIQAYILFDASDTPSRALVQRTITMIRNNMDEETFMTHWRTIVGDHPLFIVTNKDTQQLSWQVVIDFIRVPLGSETKRFLEVHPEMLQPEADVLLQELAKQARKEEVRKVIEGHRFLLAQCRDKGIDTVFTEIQTAQRREVLADLCVEMVATLRTGNAEEREALATRIEQMPVDDSFMEGIQNFQTVLLAWLRGQDTDLLTKKLQSPFREAYDQIVTLVDALTIEDLPSIVSSVILQGTNEERQQLAVVLAEAQQQLLSDAAPMGLFLGCLAAVLQGELPEVALLEPPYTDLWREFQDAVNNTTQRIEPAGGSE